MKEIEVIINGRPITVPESVTILEAAKKAGFKIPTLCHHQDLCVAGNCRICVVEVEGARTLQASCCTPVSPGMKIKTGSDRVRAARKTIIDLLLSEHAGECTRCYKNGNCELQSISFEYASAENPFIDISTDSAVDRSSPSVQKDDGKCIKCQRCVRTCAELQKIGALTMAHKGGRAKIETFFNMPMSEVVCTNCGQCINRCPTGALTERNYVEEVWNSLSDPDKHVVVQTAPAVRVGLGEHFGLNPGERVTGKMVGALRMLGFDKVFDTNFTADLTIMEEGTELLTRLKSVVKEGKKAHLPMFTSCSPGWIKFIEHEHPDMLEHLSTCKSPQQMFGALSKTYYAGKAGIDPSKIISVSIMPCTAKKFEADRPEMRSSGFKDVDYVLTTRELAQMIKQAGIEFDKIEECKCDSLLGEHTGAAVIFGATGGVMEAAIRTAYEIVTGREVPFKNLNVTPVRGMEGVKEASLKIEGVKEEWNFLEGVELKVAIAHGLINAEAVVKKAKNDKCAYHFIEVMACPGGCLGGGGQPIPTNIDIRSKRMQATYEEDESLPIRKSHENPEVKRLYQNFLTEGPLGHKSHELLHTRYTKRCKM
ncbi:MAG TPA: NADH-dependent [FeFe] hydrogenase, group A6 [Candidatus Wallbacteria bacterium]|nr:MAG: NADP-reducing hydrogenase subunit HndC [bacterium ADurb.Bin243]HPG56474.1 NADH-dependent [FeFe] hydrogenase, group A6 [Candidatus Wallbacteria bacterium]